MKNAQDDVCNSTAKPKEAANTLKCLCFFPAPIGGNSDLCDPFP
jgi:hypothetical protein